MNKDDIGALVVGITVILPMTIVLFALVIKLVQIMFRDDD